MSQTESSVLGVEDYAHDSQQPEIGKGPRVAEFHAFVAQNYDVLVESDRAPGYKAPAGVLMGMCAAEITDDNVEQFFAEFHSMLAGAASEPEEEPETEETIEDETESEEKVRRTETKSDSRKPQEPVTSRKEIREAEQPSDQIISRTEFALSTSQVFKPESSNHRSSKSGHTVAAAAISKPQPDRMSFETRAQETKEGANPAPATRVGAGRQPSPIVEKRQPIRTEPVVVSAVPEKQPEITPKQVDVEEPEKVFRVIDMADSVESFELEADPKNAGALSTELDEMTLKDSEIAGIADSDEFQQMDDEHFMDYINIEEGSEGEFVLPIPEAGNVEMPEYMTMEPEAIYELPVSVDEIEQVTHELAERIGEFEIEEAEVAHEILDQIVLRVDEARAVVELDADSQEDNPEKSKKTEEELNELFIQLFEYAGIEYTPELIEAFVRLALQRNLSELISEPNQEDDTNAVHDRGTHEIIKQILAAISSMKRRLINAVRIGSSALTLCAVS